MKMMDACECLIFVDSDNSMKYKLKQTTTPSPWIFEEIGFSQCLRINIPSRYKDKVVVNLNESQDQSTIRMFSTEQEPRRANFDYQINLKDFKELTDLDLVAYKDKLDGTKLLDRWYNKYDVHKILKKMFD